MAMRATGVREQLGLEPVQKVLWWAFRLVARRQQPDLDHHDLGSYWPPLMVRDQLFLQISYALDSSISKNEWGTNE